jgi:hypothetical protein
MENEKIELREMSRQEYESQTHLLQINAGSLQRIADATEKMAVNYVQLQKDYEYMKMLKNNIEQMFIEQLNKNRALKGVITKLKKKQPKTAA